MRRGVTKTFRLHFELSVVYDCKKWLGQRWLGSSILFTKWYQITYVRWSASSHTKKISPFGIFLSIVRSKGAFCYKFRHVKNDPKIVIGATFFPLNKGVRKLQPRKSIPSTWAIQRALNIQINSSDDEWGSGSNWYLMDCDQISHRKSHLGSTSQSMVQ